MLYSACPRYVRNLFTYSWCQSSASVTCVRILNRRKFSDGWGKTNAEKRIKPIRMSYSSYDLPNIEDPGVPIIIMHGLLGSKGNWKSLSKAINKRTKRKVISVDARNHGDSPHSSELTYDHLAEDVRQLMNDLTIRQASVIGHSMGGRTMMLLALKYPELIKELVVVDISPIGVSPSLNAIPQYLRAMNMVQLDPNLPLSLARKDADKQLSHLVADPVLRQFVLMNLVAGEGGGCTWRINLEALTNSFHDIASFPTINSQFDGPTFFIGGGKSDYMRLEDHEGIRRLFPTAEFSYIADAGHWVHSEKPQDFLDLVCSFIGKDP